jgi:endo-1,3(4)-beta-glucanase
MFALPHHVQSFDAVTAAKIQNVTLQTTTKGLATAVLSDSWTMVEEDLPTSMNFAPWSPSRKSQSILSPAAVAAISNVSISEVSQDMNAQTNLSSMYFSGKVSLYTYAKIHSLQLTGTLGSKQVCDNDIHHQ